jgi:hypothetical protein
VEQRSPLSAPGRKRILGSFDALLPGSRRLPVRAGSE